MDIAKMVFYGDLEERVRESASALLCGQSRRSFEEPLQYMPEDIKVPATYVACMRGTGELQSM
jgi:hypothetical protein